MSRRLPLVSTIACALAGAASMLVIAAAPGGAVKITPNEAERRVDVTIDGKPFTSYIWPTTLKKPVLWPIRAANGAVITRSYPLEPKAGERSDHPHQVGLWFNHGNVNGFDFWNNSEAIKPEDAKKFGTIEHRKIGEVKTLPSGEGELNVETHWVAGDGTTLLHETTKFIFAGDKDKRTIDRITTLTALDKTVVFTDNKEGVFGMRVTRALEQPATKPEIFTDASGKATKVPVLDNKGVTGEYVSSEGLKGDAVWGTRGRWTLLGGKIDNQPVTVAILDHPKNPGFPTYWHARGYGLFSANMLGAKEFSKGKEELNFAVEAGKSATFRYRVVILNAEPKPEAIEAEYKAFTAGS
jgi:Methane oxygenase PmoA